MLKFLGKLTFHPDVKVRTYITAIYCGIGIVVNFFCLQVFCMPVGYADIMCIAFFTAILRLPYMDAVYAQRAACFCVGMGVPICVYLIVFLGDPATGFRNYIGFVMEIVLFGAGLLAFIPFYLLWHIYRYYRMADKNGRKYMLLGMSLPTLTLVVYLGMFYSYMSVVREIGVHAHTRDEFMSRLPANYFTERMLGLFWKYHTSLEYIYDGWRPPLHDPFLVVALWLRIPDIELHNWPAYNEEAIKYYHRKFPNKPLQENCPCSYSPDGRTYGGLGLDSVVHQHPSSLPADTQPEPDSGAAK